MRNNYNLLLSVALSISMFSSVDGFATLKQRTSFPKTYLQAEVVDELAPAEIPAITTDSVPSIPDAPVSSVDTAASIIAPNEFVPPSNVAATKVIDPDAPMPLPSSPTVDLDTIALVAGQENYGLAIVLLGEAIWSFSKAPSVDHGLKTLLPAILAAGALGVVSGPMITSGDAGSISTGLFIATGVSVGMGVCYAARLSAPFSPSPKEIPALGLLVALAGFFSFSQNLVVDGFVVLPSLPSVDLPSLPSISLPF